MSARLVRASDLHFSWPDGSPVFEHLSFTLGPSRTGLVAANGAGKSTLLRLLAGQLDPVSGRVEVQGTLAYLPQHLPLDGDLRVSEVLGVAAKLEAVQSIAAGNAGPGLFDVVGNDWDIEERTRAALARMGLDAIAFERRLGTFSGGEAMVLGLAAQLIRQPDVLLLDEPSNNLDRQARQSLYRLVEGWNGCLLVASHDRELLEHVDQIGELGRAELRIHGGGFGAYQQAVRIEQAAAEQDVRNLRQEVKREQRQRQQSRERSERHAGNASRNLHSAGLARIVAGNRKRGAQVAAGKSAGVHAARAETARERLGEAARGLRETPDLDLALPATRVPAGRLVFSGRHVQVIRDARPLFASPGLNLEIRGPERIALSGANGTGKSTLLRVIGGDLAADAGYIRRGPGRMAYLSQRLDLLDLERTVAMNFASFAPDMPEPDRANLLARWLFRGARMHLPVRVLSGGERLRATLACLLHAEPAPQLLLLDEPTNNLDLDTASELEEALRAYEGALVVVSHDAAFLKAIGPTRHLLLADGHLGEAG
ncbi:MAG: ATP-binding cassette domain-containing protein [Luteimonas sp.]|nr:ATP-binding cassette domain-containing protein [Luteimonas sp.]